MRFYSPRREQLSPTAVDRAYLAGMEGIPWRSRNTVHQHQLLVERPLHDSGNLYIPWHVPEHGDVVLSTASLMESERPYHLPLELARGTLNRLRNYAAELQHAGLELPREILDQLCEAQRCFIRCTTAQRDPHQSAELADQTLVACFAGMETLFDHCSHQLLEMRRGNGAPLHTLLAANLTHLPTSPRDEQLLVQTFNSAAIPTTWRQCEPNAGQFDWQAMDTRLQWSQRHGLRLCAGPLIRLDRMSLPDWVYLWEDDFEQLQTCVADYVQAVVRRYMGKVHIWHAAAGLNVGGELSLTEEQRLRLAVTVIENTRRLDSQTPLVISFDQPWAEYLAKDDMDLSPIHFADALARADLGVAGVGLELHVGYSRGGTLPRDLLEISRQIDRWSFLGLPLLVSIAVPSRSDSDAQAWVKTDVVADLATDVTPRSQQQWVEQVAAMLLSKPAVHGIIWNQLFDAEPHAFPHGGLWDASGDPKPALETLATLRKQYLS